MWNTLKQTTMKTKEKIDELAKELPAFNQEAKVALKQLAKWLIQEAYDKMFDKRGIIQVENVKYYYIAFSDVDNILNELNGTPNIKYGGDNGLIPTKIKNVFH